MRRIVFLDIDGVLNSTLFLREVWSYQREGLNFSEDQLSRKLIQKLNRLVQPGVEFVLSSSWRVFEGLVKTQEMLTNKGFEGTLIDETPDGVFQEGGRFGDRGDEIQKWLDTNIENGVDYRIVILDDNSDMCHLKPFLVRTNPECGLSDRDVDKALNILFPLENKNE